MTNEQMKQHSDLWGGLLEDIYLIARPAILPCRCKKCGSSKNLSYEDLGKEDPANMLCEQCLFDEIYEREKLECKKNNLELEEEGHE